MDIGDRRVVTIPEAMTMARVSRRTMYNWIREGRLDTVYTVGGQIRIFADSLFIPAREMALKKALAGPAATSGLAKMHALRRKGIEGLKAS